MTARRLPPYGKEFRAARQAGQYCNPWILAGSGAWELAARRGPGRLVLPPGEDPAGFDWSVVAGLDVVLRWPGASAQEVDALAERLIRCGARTVNVLADIRDGRNFRGHRRHVVADTVSELCA